MGAEAAQAPSTRCNVLRAWTVSFVDGHREHSKVLDGNPGVEIKNGREHNLSTIHGLCALSMCICVFWARRCGRVRPCCTQVPEMQLHPGT